MSSATLTDEAQSPRRATSSSIPPAEQPSELSLWHIYTLLGLFGAAAAVWMARSAHPLALVLLSGAALAVAFVALMVHRTLAALLGRGGEVAPLLERRREILEKEKALVLRSIKELEFDRAMGKIGESDFSEIGSRLRARALALMEDLERTTPLLEEVQVRPVETTLVRRACPTCGTSNDVDAKYCKQCGKAV
jgi:hypothetical protein